MDSLLVRHADWLITMDPKRPRIRDGALFAQGPAIRWVGPTAELPVALRRAERVIEARGMIILPGLVNTHHHLFQTLTRVVPAAQDVGLFRWLQVLYPIWARLTPEAVYISALVGLAELVLSGCTTTSDHLYIFPNGVRLEDEIRAAQEIGIRFHPTRGGMSLGESQGGLPPDSLVEEEEAILRDSQRAIESFHQPERFGMIRIGIAPCSPFSVTPDLMREAAALARQYRVRLHTHLAETQDEERYCLERFGVKPVAYMERLGWLGEDVWHAHVVHAAPPEVELLARTGTGVAHCPSSNMRLASGIAPVPLMRRMGVPVGLGVDGSASNDSSHMLAEARQALLLQRVGGDPGALSAQEALELATWGGARVLGRDDVGRLMPDMAADFIGFRLERLAYAGALHDPVAALVFCAPQTVDLSVINGRVVVEEGRLCGIDLEDVIRRHNRISRELVNGG